MRFTIRDRSSARKEWPYRRMGTENGFRRLSPTMPQQQQQQQSSDGVEVLVRPCRILRAGVVAKEREREREREGDRGYLPIHKVEDE